MIISSLPAEASKSGIRESIEQDDDYDDDNDDNSSCRCILCQAKAAGFVGLVEALS